MYLVLPNLGGVAGIENQGKQCILKGLDGLQFYFMQL